MELIIKPTGHCNFNCTFCSASCLDIQHPENKKVPEILKDYINKIKPNGFIITGGEPLTVDPEYYYDLHNNYSDIPISITSNLKDFYLNPEKWKDLFNSEWFNVATSFNYGDSRRWDKNTVFTEEMFIKVMEKWDKYVNDNRPPFLAVIDDHNEDTALDHVYLAKRLETKVKLNNAIAVGSQSTTYPRYKMFQIYLKIIDLGLDEYELNCSDRNKSRCPRNIFMDCITNIRCCYIDKNNHLHVSICDEQLSWGHELLGDDIYPDKVKIKKLLPNECINDKCYSCDLFHLCNGCHTNRQEAKKDPNYCDEMKKIEDGIIKSGWLL